MQVNSRGNSPIALHILLIQRKTLDSPADFFFPPNWRLNLSVKDKKKKKPNQFFKHVFTSSICYEYYDKLQASKVINQRW